MTGKFRPAAVSASPRSPHSGGGTSGTGDGRESDPVCARPLRRVFPGRADQVRHARRFVARALGPGPVTDTAVLLTSELAANAVQHTNTATGGVFEVIACRCRLMAFVAVIDDGSDTVPAPRRADPGDVPESGHGLGLVELLATRWGHWPSHACPAPGTAAPGEAAPGHPAPNDAAPNHTARHASPRRVVWFGLDLPAE